MPGCAAHAEQARRNRARDHRGWPTCSPSASGRPGEVYFVTDGEPIAFREFATALLTTAGVAAPTRSLPVGVGTGLVAVAEPLWRVLRLPGAPLLSRMAFWLVSQQCTIRIDKARAELGYAPVVERTDGLAALAAADRPAG